MRKLTYILALIALSLNGFGQFSMLYSNRATGITIDSLLAYYPFNGDANDESGNGYNGAVTGATLVNGRKGETNGAYSFGLSGDFIDISAIGNRNKISISLWYDYFEGTNNGILWKGDLNTVGDYSLAIPPSQPDRCRLVINELSRRDRVIDTANFTQLVFMYDGDISRVYYGIDGSITDSFNLTLNTAGDFLRLGMYYATTNSAGGVIDDVRIYEKVLTSDEINTLYNE